MFILRLCTLVPLVPLYLYLNFLVSLVLLDSNHQGDTRKICILEAPTSQDETGVTLSLPTAKNNIKQQNVFYFAQM